MPILRRAISSSPPRPWLFGAFAVAAGVATVPIPRTSSAVPDARAQDDGGMKIVSLLPSATEIVFALGVDDELAGVSFSATTHLPLGRFQLYPEPLSPPTGRSPPKGSMPR